MFFSQKAAALKTPENQTNYKQLQNTKAIEGKKSQNKYTSGRFSNKETKSRRRKQEKDISMMVK